MRVYIDPTYSSPDQADGGIRRVVEAMVRALPSFGWDVTSTPDDADLIANHGAAQTMRPGVPMVCINHGMMWHSYGFGEWGDKVNRALIESMASAQAITAPSRWVAQAISRGMLVRPEVVYHGVEADAWAHQESSLGYVLWNKARADNVSDPRDMNDVAALLPDVPFLSTFGDDTINVRTFGAVPYDQMRTIIQRAGVYLATARETFGIGTLEALAAGVPVAGWRYGGQEEIIVEGETGYLAPYGDYEELGRCIRRCLADRERLSRSAQADVRARWQWHDKIGQYAALFTRIHDAYHQARPKVSVIITCHNLAHYLDKAIGSVVAQTMTDWECVVVDDASIDHPSDIVQRFVDGTPLCGKIHYLRTPENLKLSGARNYGFAHAKGKYVLFLDADDMLAQNALDTLSQALDQHPAIHIAYGHLDTISDDGGHQQRNPWPGSAFDWRQQIAHLNQLPYAALMRRAVLERSGGYRTRDWRAEDASLWTRVTSLGFRAAKVTEESTLIYRLRSDSKSADEARAHEDRDGDWTAWYPWRLAGNPYDGMTAMHEQHWPNPVVVPFGAQGQPPAPLRAWPVHHYQEPVVSVIIPVGPGHARYLVDALDSVQAQTMPFWECIVVDDSGQALDLTPWPWVRPKRTTGKTGAGMARNYGLAHARAPLVLFLDADDILTPNALETLLQAYADSDAGYVYSDWAHLEDETRLDGPAVFHAVPEYDPQLWLEGAQHAVTCLIPTVHARAVGGFDEHLPAWEDWDFLIKLAIAGICGQHVAAPLLIYRLATGQRRKVGDAKETELIAAIRDRYYAYGIGEKQPMGCCGTLPNVQAQANGALDLMFGAMGLTEDAPPIDPNAPTRLEFIGDAWGEQVWFSQDHQRQYKAGRDPSWRYIDVDPRDVAHLLSFDRLFARVLLVPEPMDDTPALVAEPRAMGARGARRR